MFAMKAFEFVNERQPARRVSHTHCHRYVFDISRSILRRAFRYVQEFFDLRRLRLVDLVAIGGTLGRKSTVISRKINGDRRALALGAAHIYDAIMILDDL